MKLEIHHQREIARLHFQDPNRFNREIARSTGISPNTVAAMRAYLQQSSKTWEELEPLSHDEWTAILKNADRSIAKKKPVPDWQLVHDEMQRPDATVEQLWLEFRESCPEGVAYTQFSTGYKAWKSKLHIVMRQIHRPGEKLFVDFAGRTVPITNTDGSTWESQIFVAVLGYSNYTYVEAVASQEIPNWVMCHTHCFEAFGGSTEWVVCDRLKSGVLGVSFDVIRITPAYREVLKHYDTAALPAGAYKPRHKAKAEVGVQIVQRWILFRLRGRTFFSLEEVNTELRRLCGELNAHPFKKMDGSRQSRYDETERKTLKPLPATAYEFADWRYKILVGRDHHVEHERSIYSVPFHLQRERVDIRTTQSFVEILHRGKRVALHLRAKAPGTVTTLPEHRPIEHVRVLAGEPKTLAQWANDVGPNTSQMFEFHLTSRSDPTNGLRAARRLRALADDYGPQRLEEVCTYALPLNITALRSLISILKESADKKRVQAPTTPNEVHANVRGADYYGEKK